jgi:hypothetical protein
MTTGGDHGWQAGKDLVRVDLQNKTSKRLGTEIRTVLTREQLRMEFLHKNIPSSSR